jgi:lipoate---protein ligase
VGAVPGCCLLRLSGTEPPSEPLFDVERFRSVSRRTAVAQTVPGPILVLGSTQDRALVSDSALAAAGVELARRRSGGGAVLLVPGEQLWLDSWIPRDDPLWSADVVTAAEWVGAWWVDALARCGLTGFEVHRGRSEPGPVGDVVCFAGRGPGEVFAGRRKVVGLSQWRARQGALFSSCAYLRWDGAVLAGLLAAGGVDGGGGRLGEGAESLTQVLDGVAVGVAELAPPLEDLGVLRDALLSSFPLQA